MKFLTDFTYRHLHGFARFPGDSTALVRYTCRFIPKFEGDHMERLRARALNKGGVGTNRRFWTFKPPYLRNGARYDKVYYGSLIRNQICAFDWYRNQRSWLTLKWPWTAIMHSIAFALHTCFSEPTTARSSAIAGRPRDANACQRLQNLMGVEMTT